MDEVDLSNIGSPERVDQVKPLKHSAEKRMKPNLMYSQNRKTEIHIIWVYKLQPDHFHEYDFMVLVEGKFSCHQMEWRDIATNYIWRRVRYSSGAKLSVA